MCEVEVNEVSGVEEIGGYWFREVVAGEAESSE